MNNIFVELGIIPTDYIPTKWYNFNCPICSETRKRGGLNLAYNKFHCFNCNETISLDVFVREYTTFGQEIDVCNICNINPTNISSYGISNSCNDVKSTLPVYMLLYNEDNVYVKRAIEYLKYRNISIEKAKRMGFGVVITGIFYNRLFIPIYAKGKLVSYTMRSLDNENPYRYKSAPNKENTFFNQDILHTATEIYFTEGWACAMLFKNGVANCGCSINSKKLQFLNDCNCSTINIVPDSGMYLTTNISNLENWCNQFSKLNKTVILHDITHTGKDVSCLGIDTFKKERTITTL